MGKASRKRKHDDRMRKKRAAKSARKALYASLAGTGKRPKKVGRRSQVAGIFKHAHVMTDCGNPGCNRCYPRPA